MKKLLYILLFFPLFAQAQEAVNLDGSSTPVPPHGSFVFADSSVTLDMSQNTWEQISNPTNNLFIENDAVDMTFSGDTVTIGVAGDYIMITSISFSGTAADAYEFAFFDNGVINGAKMERTTSQTDVGNVGIPTYLEDLEINDKITLEVRNTASNDDATVVSCSWIVWLLHK